ncbi:IucA/IucC family protein [Balneatrix alpica]|uniref:IucA/IucC family protein n=1 Tax=Balneatrix alpica TaxID=75684 RepID=UPI00273899F0|nr:IucA/IucC family protein [Balneatrix alpica]
MPWPDYLQASASQRVLGQLLAALFYEGWLKPQPLTELEQDYPYWHWPLAGYDCRIRARRGAFGRYRLQGESAQYRRGDSWQPLDLELALRWLEIEGLMRPTLERELRQTLAACRINEQLDVAQPRRQLPYVRLDAALHEGHPYHPCFKSRTGFSEADHLAYGPEAQPSVQLEWLALPQQQVRHQLGSSPAEFWQTQLGEATWQLLSQRLQQQGGDWQHYSLMPIHPWQRRYCQQQGSLPQDGRNGYWLGVAGDRYLPSQSLRTLFNLDRPQAADIKLPLNLVNTSSLRTLEPLGLTTAAWLSQWLQQVIDSDPLLQQRYPLGLLHEFGGQRWQANEITQGQIAVLLRDSVVSALQPGEQACPLNALMLLEADGSAFIAPWIDQYGLQPWLQQLLEVVVMPIWHLLVGQGIALEAHGQNLVLVHRDGWPCRLLVRDFHESLEYVTDFVAQPQLLPDFYQIEPAYRQGQPNQYYWMESLEALRELVMDTLFVFNLSELSALLERCYQWPESHFWQQVTTRLQRYAEEHGMQQRQQQLGWQAQWIQVEALLSRKLSADPAQERHRLVPNALAPQQQALGSGRAAEAASSLFPFIVNGR